VAAIADVHAGGPHMTVIVQQRRVSLATFVNRHGQRLGYGASHRFGIIRIDQQRTFASDRSAVLRDNLDENGASIWMRRSGRAGR
jgi:predicted ThiF/HesA family dinucleotide-utilizing enzyme